jgi:phospholipid transport system substrate-binding protein
MKRLFVFFSLWVFGLSCMGIAPAYASTQRATGFVDKVAGEVLAIIKNDALDASGKKAKVNTIFLNVVDIPFVAKFVLGKHWRTATPEQRAQYLAAYEPFLINNYVSRITKYSGQTYTIMRTRKDNNDYVVNMELLDPNGPNVVMDYRVRPAGKQFKVIDIVIENVSLLNTQRSEFNSVVTNKGLDFLIKALEKKAASTA